MIKLILMDIDGVLTDGKIHINSVGDEIKQIDIKDIDAVYEMHRRGYKIGAITGEKTSIVEFFKKRFPFDYFYSGCKGKADIIQQIQAELGLNREEICYIGDGKYDLEAIKYAGLGVCPADAVSQVKERADIVLNNKGGNGCINELLQFLDSNTNDNLDIFGKVYKEHISMFQNIYADKSLQESILRAGDLLIKVFEKGGQLLLCGNGGSAADSQHIATEFVSRFYMERKALNAEALTVNTSSITAIGNDYSFDNVFARQVEAKGKSGDILIGISTNGNSKNVLRALESAKNMGIFTVLLTGEKVKSETVSNTVDVLIGVPSSLTPRIQEAHIFIGHFLCEYVEKKLFGER